jgi:nucleoside-diphosphate-sugar epimerase
MVPNPSAPLCVLVTGCAGFIGASVGQILLDEGHQVVGIDNLNHAYDVQLKEWHLARLQERPHSNFHRVDITDPRSLQRLLELPDVRTSQPINGVINLATRAGVRPGLD